MTSSTIYVWFRRNTGNTGLKMACLPEAIIMQSALGREGIRSKVLEVHYHNGYKEVRHAVLLFCYGAQLKAWDSTWGAISIGPAENYPLNASMLGAMYLDKKYGGHHTPLLFASLVDYRIQSGHSVGYQP